MHPTKILYFYLKIENNPSLSYSDGRPYWCLDYFKNPMYILNQKGALTYAAADTIYINPPNADSKTESVDKKPWTHTCIIFDADKDFMDNLDIPYMSPIHIEKPKELERLMFDMENYQISASRFKQDSQDACLLLILIALHDYLHPASADYSVEAGEDLAQLRHQIMNSTGIFWTLESMARHANMSVRGFGRKYKEIYGKSPIADLYDFRFVRAKRLLDTGYSINHILNSCGFKSPQHFSTFFKRRTGMTPTEYAKRKSPHLR